MFAFLLVTHLYAVPIYPVTEQACMKMMNTTQHHMSPDKIVFMACFPL